MSSVFITTAPVPIPPPTVTPTNLSKLESLLSRFASFAAFKALILPEVETYRLFFMAVIILSAIPLALLVILVMAAAAGLPPNLPAP